MTDHRKPTPFRTTYQSAHSDRITGGPATRRHRYLKNRATGERTAWDYAATSNLAPNAEIEYWNAQTGRWE